MRNFIVVSCFLSVLECVSAGGRAPQLTIGINGGTDGTPVMVQPAIKWVTDVEVAGCDVEGGVVTLVEDLGTISYDVWGKVTRTFGGVDLSARADVSSSDKESIDLDLRVDGDIGNAQVTATIGAGNKAVGVNNVQVSKGFGLFGGRFNINPRYNVKDSKADVKLGYGLEKTSFAVDVSGDSQKLTVSREIGDNTVVSPSITTDLDFSFSVQQSTGYGKITGTFKADDSINIKWQDGPWVASMNAPIEGYEYNGVKFDLNKHIDFD